MYTVTTTHIGSGCVLTEQLETKSDIIGYLRQLITEPRREPLGMLKYALTPWRGYLRGANGTFYAEILCRKGEAPKTVSIM